MIFVVLAIALRWSGSFSNSVAPLPASMTIALWADISGAFAAWAVAGMSATAMVAAAAAHLRAITR
jgi:hypothetical protein